MDILTMSIIIAGVTVAIGTIGPATGQGRAVSSAMDGIARQPEAAGQIQTNLIIGLAFMESLTIYALVIALILLFANPLTKAEKAKAEVQTIESEIALIQAQAKLDTVKKEMAAVTK